MGIILALPLGVVYNPISEALSSRFAFTEIDRIHECVRHPGRKTARLLRGERVGAIRFSADAKWMADTKGAGHQRLSLRLLQLPDCRAGRRAKDVIGCQSPDATHLSRGWPDGQ